MSEQNKKPEEKLPEKAAHRVASMVIPNDIVNANPALKMTGRGTTFVSDVLKELNHYFGKYQEKQQQIPEMTRKILALEKELNELKKSNKLTEAINVFQSEGYSMRVEFERKKADE